jgi:hypothetical protein
MTDDVAELAAELRQQRSQRIQHLEAQSTDHRGPPHPGRAGSSHQESRVETSARTKLTSLRTALADNADRREVFQALFPDGLTFAPARTPDGERRVWRISGTASYGSLTRFRFRTMSDPNGIRRIRNRAPLYPIEIPDLAQPGPHGWLVGRNLVRYLGRRVNFENGVQVQSLDVGPLREPARRSGAPISATSGRARRPGAPLRFRGRAREHSRPGVRRHAVHARRGNRRRAHRGERQRGRGDRGFRRRADGQLDELDVSHWRQHSIELA